MTNNVKIEFGYYTIYKKVNIKVDVDKNLVIVNNNTSDADAKSLSKKILQIVSSWKEDMINKDVLDGLNYYVNIQKDKKITKYEGANLFPENFDKFFKLIQEVESHGKSV